MSKKWMYIFVRKDLSSAQIAVQSIHSAFEMGREYDPSLTHPSVVLIKVNNEQELSDVEEYLKFLKINFKKFHEPYYENSLTSICVQPIDNENRSLFKKFKLIQDQDFYGMNNER
jgi:hypothetical protein